MPSLGQTTPLSTREYLPPPRTMSTSSLVALPRHVWLYLSLGRPSHCRPRKLCHFPQYRLVDLLPARITVPLPLHGQNPSRIDPIPYFETQHLWCTSLLTQTHPNTSTNSIKTSYFTTSGRDHNYYTKTLHKSLLNLFSLLSPITSRTSSPLSHHIKNTILRPSHPSHLRHSLFTTLSPTNLDRLSAYHHHSYISPLFSLLIIIFSVLHHTKPLFYYTPLKNTTNTTKRVTFSFFLSIVGGKSLSTHFPAFSLIHTLWHHKSLIINPLKVFRDLLKPYSQAHHVI